MNVYVMNLYNSQQNKKSIEQSMDKSRLNSPSKQQDLLQSPSLTGSKSRLYLPSRYAQQKVLEKTGFQDILNEIQSHVKQDQIETNPPGSPQKSKIKPKDLPISMAQLKPADFQFKTKPLKRQEHDLQNFNEIFLNHREEALKQLQKTIKPVQTHKMLSKEYEKLLMFENGTGMEDKNDWLNEPVDRKNYQECIEMLESEEIISRNEKNFSDNFYEEHIQLDPPDYPNSSNSSTMAPGSGYAPSIPLNFKGIKDSNIRELLIRAKAGMNTDDVEKEAHLSYFLGEVYESKRNYQASLKFYRRFLGFAKAMEDKIGMSLGANRVGISYFHCGEVHKSIIYHNENLKLSDTQNCFAGFYNLGICYRNLNKLQESLEYLQSAYNWAHEKGDQESECISLSQIGVTYQRMELYQQSLDYFQKSLEISQRIKKNMMELNNLREILRITAQFSLKPTESLQQIANQAYNCSKLTPYIKLQNILGCNIGILRGSIELKTNIDKMDSPPDIQQLSQQ